MPAREQQALIRGYAQVTAQMRLNLLTMLITLFRGLGSWRDADQARFTRAAVPLVSGAQRQMTSLTGAYLTALRADMLGVRPNAVPAGTAAQVRGVDPDVVYARPFRTLYASLGEGREFPAALDDAVRRLSHIAATDLQLAKTHAARAGLADDERVLFYQRVLVGATSCGLCVVASTQRYRRGDLMPIHPGCDCAVAPVVGDQDPGQVINRRRLEDVHDAIEDMFGKSDRGRDPVDFRDLLVEHVHGEIGPVLARKGDRFTGPGDLPG